MAHRETHAGPEYRLLIAPRFNELGQKHTTIVELETVKTFASFQYELSVRETITNRSVHLKVLGLRTPHLSLPATGHARFTREFDDLKGVYNVTVEGLDGRTNTFQVRITQSQVKVLDAPASPFIELVTDQIAWSDH
ncbi:MAG TPA: hypothetical protein VF889_04820 [Bacteroidota bacterium]